MGLVYSRPYTGPLKAVLLDWSGTTLDYGCCAPAVVFMEVFRRHKVPISIQQARIPMGVHKKKHIREILQMEEVNRMWEETHGCRPTDVDVETMFKEFIPLQLKCLAKYADLIPGTLEAVTAFREQGLKVGSTTGYTREMMTLLLEEARARGYQPDSTVCASDVPAGRPYPWMCFKNACNLEIYPLEAFVKIGDTLPDIGEGINAGMWTIGLTKTGNEIGLTEREIKSLDPEVRRTRIENVCHRMREAGAHYTVDGIYDVPPLLEEISERLAQGERP